MSAATPGPPSGSSPEPSRPAGTTPPPPPPPAAGKPGSGKPGKAAGKAGSDTDAAGNPLRGSRTSGFWAGVIAVTILLILLIIFIAQNTESAGVKFLGFEGTAPQAVLLLIATVTGMVVTIIAGSLRILQLRRRVKRENK